MAREIDRLELMAILEEEYEEHGVPSRAAIIEKVSKWLFRGDGVAVFENHDLGHGELGHKKILSYGSRQAWLESDVCHIRPASPESGLDVERHEREAAEANHLMHTAPLIDGHPVASRSELTGQFLPCPQCSVLPDRMPDTPSDINWRYQLEATCREEAR